MSPAPTSPLISGTITFGSAKVDCTIRSISASGATLNLVSSKHIPDQFVLVAGPKAYACNVVRRTENSVGVVFA
jgi:hypothetical protein